MGNKGLISLYFVFVDMIAIGSLFAASDFLKLEAPALYRIIDMLGNKLHFALFKTA